MRRAVYSLLASVTVAVSLLSFRASTQPEDAAAVLSPTASTSSPTSTAPAAPTSAAAAPTASSSAPTPSATSSTSSSASVASTLADGTYTGTAVTTPYGPVQVQVTVSGGAITAADAIAHPSGDRRSDQINARAVPVLDQEAVQAGSASISMVSGATFTSQGYRTSLQSALDQAQG